MANTRRYQLLAAEEIQPGVLATGLVAVGNAKTQIKDPKVTITNESYAREIIRGTLSNATALSGKVEVEYTFSVEMAGNTTAATEPVWAKLMRAASFEQKTFYAGQWSGVFTGSDAAVVGKDYLFHGQIVQTAAAAKTAMVVHDHYQSASVAESRRMFLVAIIGTPASADVFFPLGGAVGVGPVVTLTTSVVAGGVTWYPTTSPIVSMTLSAVSGANSLGDVYRAPTTGAILQSLVAVTGAAGMTFRDLDGVPPAASEVMVNLTQTGTATIHGTPAFAQPTVPTISLSLIQDGRIITSKGCRGTVSMSAERGKPVFLNFSFKGVLAANPGNAGPLSGVTFDSQVPPKFQGIGCLVGSYVTGEPGYFSHATAHIPRINAMTLDLGNTVNTQEDATKADGITNIAHVTGRASQGSIKTDVRPEAAFPFRTKQKNSEPFRLQFAIGSLAKNRFLISAPGCVISGVSDGDSNGFGQDDVSFSIGALKPDLADGEDRELNITYHYADTAAGAGSW